VSPETRLKTPNAEACFLYRAWALLLIAACGNAQGLTGARLDAAKDHAAPLADAATERSLHDAYAEPDATPEQRHFVDAAIACDGGGGWAPCFVTDAAELACEASTDCTWQDNQGTCCGVPTIGVNKSAPAVGCPGLPCPPPKTNQPECSLYFTQDCEAVTAASDVLVDCVDHRCVTRAASH
jgi:hypothetical protein